MKQARKGVGGLVATSVLLVVVLVFLVQTIVS